MSKLISVLMPVFNVEEYIEEALSSVLNQTYKHFEIIVIDDGSTDSTAAIVERMALVDSRIRLLRNPQNMRIVQSLNRGLSMAAGSYIARMDGDDISMPDRFEKFVEHLEKHPNIELVGCSVISIDTKGIELGRTRYPGSQQAIVRTFDLQSPVAHIWLAKRDLYKKLQGYREMPGVEDYDFLLRAMSSNVKFENIDSYYGYKVRISRAGNSSATFGLRQRKMHHFVLKLYQERMRRGHDSFTPERFHEAISSSRFYEKIHCFATASLSRAIRYRAGKRYCLMMIFAAFALVSPAQFAYLYARLKLRAATLISQ
jgi:glycosyltransferase involved in cell wall biosynthesis